MQSEWHIIPYNNEDITMNHYNNDITQQGILWSCICRGDKILCEAGADGLGGEVVAAAKTILKKKDTPGWEFSGNRRSAIKGVKFHVYDKDKLTDEIVIWKYAAVYDSNSVGKDQVQSFLEKMAMITEMQRQEDYNWRYGSTLAAQEEFAPILLQRQQEVAYLGRLAMVNSQIDSAREIMHENIELILQRGEKLEDMQERATRLQDMGKQFKKRAKQIKRFQHWQNAKYGLVVGTAVTGVVAIVVVPPLIALL
jgi:tetrahydromethanopterin S-methyltransferase subunit B